MLFEGFSCTHVILCTVFDDEIYDTTVLKAFLGTFDVARTELCFSFRVRTKNTYVTCLM